MQVSIVKLTIHEQKRKLQVDAFNKAKDDKMLHDKLQVGLQFSDEMQELLRREVQFIIIRTLYYHRRCNFILCAILKLFYSPKNMLHVHATKINQKTVIIIYGYSFSCEQSQRKEKNNNKIVTIQLIFY